MENSGVLTVFLLMSLLAATPVSAIEPWEGTWSDNPDPKTCSSERGADVPLIVMTRSVTPGIYGQGPGGDEEPKGDEGQITFEQQADPWVCYIGKITNVVDLDAWIFDVECGGEGIIWRDRTIVMLTESPKGIAAYNLVGKTSVQLYRCSEIGG